MKNLRILNGLFWGLDFLLFTILFLLINISVFISNTYGQVDLTQFLFFVLQDHGADAIETLPLYSLLAGTFLPLLILFGIILYSHKQENKPLFIKPIFLLGIEILLFVGVSYFFSISRDALAILYSLLWLVFLLNFRKITLGRAFCLWLLLLPLLKIIFFDTTIHRYFDFEETTLYQENFVNVSANMPLEKPRNIIVIFAESLNEQYRQIKDSDTEIADKEAVKFSKFIEGYAQRWTQGALFSAFTGVHIHYLSDFYRYKLQNKINWIRIHRRATDAGELFDFDTPNIRYLGDIFKQHGYQNLFVQGSSLKFSGTETFLSAHGFDKANMIGLKHPRFKLWGSKDEKVFATFKERLSQLDKKRPFFAAMFTMDLHNGRNPHYKNRHEVFEQTIANINDFISWFKQQDFYTNTTLIVLADHQRMGQGASTGQKLYNAFFNLPEILKKSVNTKRSFNQIDLFPTLLEIAGFQVPYRKAGMGTSLFSTDKTLAERYSYSAQKAIFSKIDFFYQKLWSKEKIPFSPFAMNKQSFDKQEQLIAHAGGVLNHQKYLNNMDALHESVRRGYKYIELDLLETKDNRIIAAHDWKSLRKSLGLNKKDEALSLKELEDIALPQSILKDEQILEFFLAHPSLYLVTDKIDNFSLLRNKFEKLQNRMIVEVFSPLKFQEAKNNGFTNIAYSIRNINDFRIVEKNSFNLVTIGKKFAQKHRHLVYALKKKGVTIMIYSLENTEEIKKYFPLGDVFYYDGEECLKRTGC